MISIVAVVWMTGKCALRRARKFLGQIRRRLARLLVPGASNLPNYAMVLGELTEAIARQSSEMAQLKAGALVMDVAKAELADAVKAELVPLKTQLARVVRTLSESGHFEVVSPTKPEDPTSYAALSYASREQSIFVYRAAFKMALDYLRATKIHGPVVEFGSCTGFTARCIADLMAQNSVTTDMYLFDSFEGLPEVEGTLDSKSYEHEVNRIWLTGNKAVPPHYPKLIKGAIARLLSDSRVRIVKGLFEHTMGANLPVHPCSLIHIDCDLYESTKYVLYKLLEMELFQDGCVVMFDDFNCNRANPTMGERRALSEFLASQRRWTCSPWFSYGWHGQAFFFHDRNATLA